MRSCLTISILLLGLWLHAQDADMFFATRARSVLDPSRVGFTQGLKASLIHRREWLSLPDAWRSDLLNVDMDLRNKKKAANTWLAIGLNVAMDRSPATNIDRSSTGIMTAVHLRVADRSFLSLGMETKWYRQNNSLSDGQWGSQYNGSSFDPSLPSGEQFSADPSSALDLRAGISYTLKNARESMFRSERDMLIIGISADHLARVVLEGSSTIGAIPSIRYNAYAFGELPHESWDNGFLAADVIIQQQGTFLTGRVNAYVGKHTLNLDKGKRSSVGFKAGVGYRLRDALLINGALDLDWLSFGMSYGWSVFNSNSIVSGRRTFEFMLQIRALNTNKRMQVR